jgi:hypothetical protein
MARLSETFHWMFEDERWRYKILFQGLILLVPVVGVVALLGWMMITCESLLAGRLDVAPAGFHLRRGARPFAIGVTYWLGLGAPYALLRSLDTLWAGALPLGVVAQVYNDVALLCFLLLIVPVLVATDRDGLLAGLDVVRIIASIVSRPARSLVLAGVVLVAVLIGILGFTVIVAAPFTIAYAASIIAGIAAWWARPPQVRAAAARTADGRPEPFRPPQVEPDAERS